MEILGYKAVSTVKTMMEFERLSGKSAGDFSGTITDMVFMLRAAVSAAYKGKEPKELKDKLEALSTGELMEAVSGVDFFPDLQPTDKVPANS
jgi:hypothetical protein